MEGDGEAEANTNPYTKPITLVGTSECYNFLKPPNQRKRWREGEEECGVE